MQTKESEKSDLKSPALRVIEANFVSRKHRKSLLALWLMAVVLFTSAGAQKTNKSKTEPLMIQEQGSFAVGGSVITAPGTFDPIRQGAYEVVTKLVGPNVAEPWRGPARLMNLLRRLG